MSQPNSYKGQHISTVKLYPLSETVFFWFYERKDCEDDDSLVVQLSAQPPH